MGLFHSHKWVEIFKKPVTVTLDSAFFFKGTWDEEATLVVEQCSKVKCREKRAYIKDVGGTKTTVDIDYAERLVTKSKHIIDKK